MHSTFYRWYYFVFYLPIYMFSAFMTGFYEWIYNEWRYSITTTVKITFSFLQCCSYYLQFHSMILPAISFAVVGPTSCFVHYCYMNLRRVSFTILVVSFINAQRNFPLFHSPLLNLLHFSFPIAKRNYLLLQLALMNLTSCFKHWPYPLLHPVLLNETTSRFFSKQKPKQNQKHYITTPTSCRVD